MTKKNVRNVRVLGIVGSPRVSGNTDMLIDKILEGVACSGAKTSKIYLSKMSIAPCRACQGCKKAGRCVVKDDMQGVLDQLEASSIWILGTPVYFWGPTGWFKAFIDRFYGAREHLDFSNKKVIVVVPFEDTNIATARHTVGMIHDTMDYFKVPILADIVVPGVLNRGDVKDNSKAMELACQAGWEAVSHIPCSNMLNKNN